MKKRFLCSLLLAIGVLVCMAQTMQKHTVQRGETMESIAQKYGVTVSAMKEANPNIGEYFYVGMVLNVPERVSYQERDTAESVANIVANSQTEQVQSVSTIPTETSLQVAMAKGDEDVITRKGRWLFTGRCGWHVLDYEKGMDLNGWGTNTMFGSNYFFSEQAYLKLCAGVANATKSKGDITKEGRTSVEMWNIRVPVSINYLIPMGGHRGFSVGVGPYLDYVVYGKSEYKQGNTKIKTKFSDMENAHSMIFGIHLQATLMFSEMFGLFGEYGFGLSERYKGNKENYWSVGIAYGL